MASSDLGKKFEESFRRNWMKVFPGTFIYRLPDQMSGYKNTSNNPCDFLALPVGDKLFMVECKEHKGASIPLTAIPQYDRLLSFKDVQNVYPGVLVWLSEKDIIFWCPIKSMEAAVKDGNKSFGLKMLKEKSYNMLEIPSVKKRTFLECDYSVLVDWTEENK